jgi:hypothetical protein
MAKLPSQWLLPISVWWILLFSSFPLAAHGARFVVTGPVLTVTLKDPDAGQSAEIGSKWLNLGNLRPNLLWSLQSQSKPLPDWLPSLQSLKANIGYRYEDLKRMPSFVDTQVEFSNSHGELQLQPTFEFRSKRTNLLVQASRGSSYLLAKFASKGERWLEFVRGNYQVDLPYASVGGIRITPTFDFRRNEPSCMLEGVTQSKRTKAVLNLEYNNPTLTVVHALDERYVMFLLFA